MCDMYNSPVVNYNETSEDQSGLWTSQESNEEDKVILETEITLKTGPNITMKIHEESRTNESEEDTKKQGVIKILNEDSESDYYESRRSPRKVRFGGESFKLRTPESDSSQQAEDDEAASTIKITVTDAISIKTRKSLIPIRISSLPSTPKKTTSVYQAKHFKSAPNLTSRIPLKKKPSDKDSVKNPSKPRILKHSRGEDVLSPIPIHNEIEVFHNLTRSPDRSGNSSPKFENDSKAFNSFTVCKENEAKLESNDEKNDEKLPKPTSEETNVKKASLQQSLSSLTSDDEIWTKSEALDSLVKMLKEPGTCETLEPGPAALLFEALFACHHRGDRLHTLADDALTTLIGGIREGVLEQCLPRLSMSICKMEASSGVRCALVIMKKLAPKKLQAEILAKGFSHRTREGALQILMACARLYPKADVEAAKIAEFAARALRDRRRRVRHASLETLAAIAQITSPQEVLKIVEDSQDFDAKIMEVVRIRLSRKQLPKVDVNGSIRYSSPMEQSESDWIAGGDLLKSSNSVSSPLSSASSSTPSVVNYWMHNSRHDENDPAKNGKSNNTRASRGTSLRPVYILQPDIASIENGKNRTYDRGRSFSPSKPYRTQFPENNNHRGSFNDVNKHFEFNPRLNYPAERHHGFRKSFSSDQLYFNNRLPSKHEPYSFSLSSRSSSTSTGSSTRSGFWGKDFRSAIPVPISETKLKIRHGTSSIVSSNGPLIAKRSVFSPHQTPSSSSKLRNSATQENDSAIGRLSLVAPRRSSSGSESSSGYFTPSPPEKHHPAPAFIKMDSTEERLSSDVDNNNLEESLVDKSAVVGDGSLTKLDNHQEQINIPTEVNDCLGETIHDNYPSVESLNLNEETPSEKRPPSRTSESATIETRRKSKSVVDLPNFLPKINSARKNINSAPPRNDDTSITNNNNQSVDTCDNFQLPPMDYAIEQHQEIVTVTKSKLEQRFSRNSSRKSVRVTPRTVTDSTPRPPSKPKDLLQQFLQQMENPNNWETTVEGLQILTKLSRQHPETIENQMHHVCLSLAKQIKNLRSQVSRVACNTATELFLSCKKGLEMEFEEIACPLLQRSADTNRFLRADANAALDVMCEQLPAHRVIPVITSRGCCHQNAIVRAAAVRLLGDLVKRLGAERVFQMPKELKDKLLLAGANALADGNLETRSQGKSLIGYLIKHPNFQRCLHEAVPQSLLMHISKSLASIKT